MQIEPNEHIKKRITGISVEYGMSVSEYGKMLLKIGISFHDHGLRLQQIRDNMAVIAKTILREESK